MAWTRSVVRPSCSRKMRCPRPHRGAVRNWSPPAPPCETLSAKPEPMWWISISEYAFTGALLNEPVKLDTCVVPTVGLWQVAQPIELNKEAPAEIVLELTVDPFSTTEPVGGGASARMKLAKAETSSRTAEFGVAAGLDVSSG